MIPGALLDTVKPVTIVCGHYGVGKTNFSVNLACDLSAMGKSVTLIDLDIVNPYFRASEQRELLEQHGVRLIAPVFAERGTSLDVPSLTGAIIPAIDSANDDAITVIDVGGDDVGATALGRFSSKIVEGQYAMLCVLNRFRNLVQDPEDALQNLREIEVASHVKATALVDNAHLKGDTTARTIERGMEYAQEVSRLSGLPIVCVTVPETLGNEEAAKVSQHIDDSLNYAVRMFVRNPWE